MSGSTSARRERPARAKFSSLALYYQVAENFVCRLLEVRISGRARERDDVADIFEAGEIHHHSFQSQTEAGVGDGAVPTQVEIPPIRLFIQAAVTEPLQKHIVAILALAAADDLADPRN